MLLHIILSVGYGGNSMVIVLWKRKIIIWIVLLLLILSIFFLGLSFLNGFSITTTALDNQEVTSIIDNIFKKRNKAMIEDNIMLLDSLYNKELKYGLWAYEHEIKKMRYLNKWSGKQGVKIFQIDSLIKIRHTKEINNKLRINFISSTQYKYYYVDKPKQINLMRIGTYHSMDIERLGESWVIVREWYTDPFADSLHLDEIKSKPITEFILEQNERNFSNLNERRKNALNYMDRYCGAAADEEYEFEYNSKYKNYNSLGGDCANFASQILYEGGKFKKNYTWNYEKDGSRAWVNAQAFKNYMLYSGRASRIAYGTFEDVYKASYKMLPGDFVAYEKSGKVTHISVVSGTDSKGYTLVNSHNTDRYRVPWDLGWSNKGIKFWLIHVHY